MIQITRVDYNSEHHTAALINLLDAYARDPMGGGQPLSDFARRHIITGLVEHQGISLLAFASQQPAGLLNAFAGFSTFACKPLINIHDVAVLPEFRGQGISQQLLQSIEDIAREQGCCKLTLEVLSGNTIAASAYQKFGFSGYQLDPQAGRAEFWEKKL
ncbi:GNAT family N-acetyltransferase [Gilvimarinus agarilyticus]|uniref:GNAT family N-acetyltransferase n=1 Tax=Gilvimarinus agarilyticus TaxID=679259 RepID=UPI0005A23018|nr:GNAT family N-acetyltransferase [Gilvimarinus agarilyticus]